MVLGSFFFKHKAKLALKGNWQTALLVTFFAGILLTAAQVMNSRVTGEFSGLMSSFMAAYQSMAGNLTPDNPHYLETLELARKVMAAVESVPASSWMALLVLYVLALAVTPALTVSCKHYFIRRVDGEDIGFVDGMLARMPIFLKSLWLHIVMAVRVALWSLLLIVPGIVAAIRYSQAPYYLAENPELRASEAIRKSKESMQHMKMSYFMLQLSFVGWNLLVNLLQLTLLDISPVVALVVAQFASLAVSTYLNASNAVFFTAVSRTNGVEKLVGEARSHMRQMGMDDSMFDHETIDEEPSDGGDDE